MHSHGGIPSTVQATFEKGDIQGLYPEFERALREFHKYQDRGKLYAHGSKYQAVVNCTGLCVFAIQMDSIPFPLIEFVSAATGWDFSVKEALTTGHRIQTLRQAFLTGEGISPKDIHLPKRMVQEPAAGASPMNVAEFENLRTSFYKAMGWESSGSRTGYPLLRTIKALGLEDLVAERGVGKAFEKAAS